MPSPAVYRPENGDGLLLPVLLLQFPILLLFMRHMLPSNLYNPAGHSLPFPLLLRKAECFMHCIHCLLHVLLVNQDSDTNL